VRRREFITLLGGAAAAWPLAARAQQPAMPVIGFLSTSPGPVASIVVGFRGGLNETGFIEGQNLAIEYRWADQYDQLPALAADLVHRQVTVIAASGLPAAVAAKAATTTIPIVFQLASDPVALGLVASLNRPGGNLTGLTSLNEEMGPKRLELLHEVVPTATSIALLMNPTSPNVETLSRQMQAVAHTLSVEPPVLHASNERDLDTVFATLGRLQAGGLVAGAHAFFNSRSERLAALALRHAAPMITPYREFAAAGGLMSYGHSITEQYRQAGIYVGRILKGEKPSDLPVQQATKVELIINPRTAKALGITVPLPLSGRADEVIE
jgi:putative tryptophan/tyrosine transport system substrate-binding protein